MLSLYTLHLLFSVYALFHWISLTLHRYKIIDLPGENAFYVDLDLRVCFNDVVGGISNPCVIHTNLLEDTKLPKTACGWEKGFIKQSK